MARSVFKQYSFIRKELSGQPQVRFDEQYRSGQNILDFGYNAIQGNNPLRLEIQQNIDKKLISNVTDAGGISIWHFENYLQEVKAVVDDIEKNFKDAGGYSGTAILVRANQHAAPFAEALKSRGIPFIMRDTQGLLRFEEIKDLLIFKIYSRPRQYFFFRLASLPVME